MSSHLHGTTEHKDKIYQRLNRLTNTHNSTTFSLFRTTGRFMNDEGGYSVRISNCRGVGGVEPLPHIAEPPTSGQNSTPGVEFQPPHLSFAEVGILLDSHFLLNAVLKISTA